MIETYQPTHKELVGRMRRWVSNKHNCNVVMAELTTRVSETPDVIGFYGHGASILIECKISRSDFRADFKKWFRRHEEMGMGDRRYFAVPKGLVKPDEVPEGWGLLEVSEHQVKETKEAAHMKAKKENEVAMLMSAIRRLELSTAVFVRHDVFEQETEDERPETYATHPENSENFKTRPA